MIFAVQPLGNQSVRSSSASHLSFLQVAVWLHHHNQVRLSYATSADLRSRCNWSRLARFHRTFQGILCFFIRVLRFCFKVHLFGIQKDFAIQIFCEVLQAFLGQIEVDFNPYFSQSVEISAIQIQAWLTHSYDLHLFLWLYLTGKASLNYRK